MKVTNALLEQIDCFSSFDEAVQRYKFTSGLFISSNAESLFNEDIVNIIMRNNNVHCYPDGVGATIVLRSKLKKKSVKVPGCELWLAVLKERCLSGQCKIALLGAKQDVIAKVSSKILALHENAQIVYARNGYDIDTKEVVSDISASEPDIVFIATGQPSQEKLGDTININHPKSAVFCIGGSFDLFAGKVSRAPKLMVKLNLEWLYRVYIQPYRAHRVFPTLFNVLKVVLGIGK